MNLENDEWLNLFQMKNVLGMKDVSNADPLLLAELGRYEQRDHPCQTWKEAGMKEYHYVKKSGSTSSTHTHDHSFIRTMDTSKAKALKNDTEGDPPIKINWPKACKALIKNIKTEVTKGQKAITSSKKIRATIKKMDKLHDLLSKLADAEGNFNARCDGWQESLMTLESQPHNEETHQGLTDLKSDMTNTTVAFQKSVDGADKARKEAEELTSAAEG